MMCIDFFSQNRENTKICKLLQEISEETLLEWERQTASEHSPCPVKNEEFLYRQILNPIHYDIETMTLKPTAFNDVSDKGMSVNRLDYASEESICQTATDRVERYNMGNPDKPTRFFLGLVRFNCTEVRNIIAQPSEAGVIPVRGCVVYDTAYEYDQSHADIFQIVKNKAHERSVRSKIMDLANDFLLENPFASEIEPV